ncbi:hypothetical protein [Dyadobacter sp. CY312]|uniref:DUF1281 family ferredoxin-like fold protein n=1 Tax=Dyadobacter sp. CY312 TaxID=2907303 RepID=UPI001F3A0B4E|nr:hypothetical protein [Dyadobacter sp. CY312]MCE7039178.1 hypothetical protein [Dyadobacter sp. CY312]
MPNHIQNRLRIIASEEKVKEVLTFLCGENKEGEKLTIDFNKIKPMPETLNIESGSEGSKSHFMLFGNSKGNHWHQPIEDVQSYLLQMTPEKRLAFVQLGLQYQENKEKYGHTTWYGWAVDNWGTKWNAYNIPDERDSDDTIFFQTAWSAPVALMKELSKKFPEVTIQFDYSDEDSSSNTGIVTIEDGEITDSNFPDSGSTEGYELYFELHPGSEEYYEFVDGEYRYNEEEYESED